MRVETVMLGPDTEQYAGDGGHKAGIAEIAASARRLEVLGYDGVTAPEAGHDPYLPLAIAAESILKQLHYENVSVRPGDGSHGWPELAPLDGIIITAAPESLPLHLLPQLAVGGRLVAPVGKGNQELFVITKTEDSYTTEFEMAVRFVPMTGAILEH